MKVPVAPEQALPALERLWERRLLLLCLLIGALVRAYAFGDVPPGLNQDEATSGYDAWALMNHGIDRNGFHNPVHLVSFGSGQNALYSYLAMPFIAVFGLNPAGVRALSLVFGLLTLVVFHRFVKSLTDEPTALCAAFLLAVNPWHIMLCRWALESNLFPGIFLIGAWLLARAVEIPWRLPLAFACFAVSLYGYGAAYVVAPLFLGLVSVYLLYHGKISRRMLLGSWAVFVVLALPIGLFVLVDLFKLDSIELGLFSIPRLPDTARFKIVTSLFDGSAIAQLGQNFVKFLELLVAQNDPSLANQIAGYGHAYLFSAPFAVLGLGLVLAEVWPLRRYTVLFLIAAWFLASGLLGFIYVDPNTNRVNILFLPILFFTAVALVRILRWVWARSAQAGRAVLGGLVLLYGISFGAFTHAYFTSFPKMIGPYLFEGLGEAVLYAEHNAPGPICVTSSVNMPYIYVLFYTKTDPLAFQSTVRWANPRDTSPQVASFGRYSFGKENCKDPNSAALILLQDELPVAFRMDRVVQTFKNYVVVLPYHSEQTGIPMSSSR